MGLFDRFIGLEGDDKKTKFDTIPFNKDDTNQPYVPVHGGLNSTTEKNNAFVKDNFGLLLPKLDPKNAEINGTKNSSDWLIRGGLGAASYALEDAYRLNQYFFDDKNSSGLLFILKQNILSQTSVRTEASRILNAGAYTPFSTLLQAATGFAGVHLFKQGIDPTGLIPLLSIRKYEDVVKKRTKRDDLLSSQVDNPNFLANRASGGNNRIINGAVSALEGIGGGSITSIYSNRLLKIWDKKQQKETGFLNDHVLIYPGGPSSLAGIGFTRIKFADQRTGINNLIYKNDSDYFFGKTYKNISDWQETFPNEFDDYKHPKYIDYNIEKSYNFNSPGRRGVKDNYTNGKGNPNITGSLIGPSDKLNAQPIYKSDAPKLEDEYKDIIDFRIAIIDNASSNFKDAFYLHFRAFIDNFSDSYNASWKGTNYMGRAEEFHKYDSFKRKISLDFKVAAQSKQELMVQYEKLNFLASGLAPSYSEEGYMSGNLFKIDLGGYLYNQHCIVNSLSYDFSESPWEIGINVEGGDDPSVVQLPHIIKVKMSITPIHDFRVERQEGSLGHTSNPLPGNQNYIARNQAGNDGVARDPFNINVSNDQAGNTPTDDFINERLA